VSESRIIIVTHGTVMSLYYQVLSGEDAYSFWQRLGLPAFYTVSWPDGEVLSIEKVSDNG
jgi:broad specificity phosphatase PhoE